MTYNNTTINLILSPLNTFNINLNTHYIFINTYIQLYQYLSLYDPCFSFIILKLYNKVLYYNVFPFETFPNSFLPL